MSEQTKPVHPMETIRILQSQFPAAFPLDGRPPKPLAIGVFGTIREATRDDISNTRLKRALAWWCGRLAYVEAVAAGGQRYNLDGHPAGDISDADRQSAAERVVEVKARLAVLAEKRRAEAEARRAAAAEKRKAEAKAARKAAKAAKATSQGKGQGKGQNAPTALSGAFQQAVAKVAAVKESADPKKRARPEFSGSGKKVQPKAAGEAPLLLGAR